MKIPFPELSVDRKTLKITIIAAAIFSVTAYASLGRSGRIERVEASTVIETNTASADDPIKARAAFNEAVKVFFSARCSNCHPAGDGPTQGDEHRIHDQDVKRGTDGKGVAGMECATCHQAENMDGDGLPPGAPNWHMPPADTKMVFQGITAAGLCQQLKDPARNGNRKTLKESIQHIETDPLVGWSWDPGNGRSTPPLSKADFLKKLNEWIDAGAACPE
ncbi:MAG: hypothetical protein IPP63_01735 [Chloracidobacterium sp.]|nr:hypothetical protein [Chloracidobacterium sp.]